MSEFITEGAPITAPLTDAEVRVCREQLGLTAEQLAAELGVRVRTIHRWEHGVTPIPAGAADEIGRLTDEQDTQVEQLVMLHLDQPEPVLQIPRAGEHLGRPAGWWRAVAGMVVADVRGLRVVYRSDVADTPH